MSQPALPSNLVSIEQLLAVLPVRRSRRWMVQYLHKTKVDLHGRPLYRRLGRDMLIYLDRVIEALPCPSESLPHATKKRRASTFGDHTSASLLTRAAELTGDTSLLPSSNGSRPRSSAANPERQLSKEEPTFLSAAVAYMEAGRRRRYVPALIRHFGGMPLREINQEAIDRAASAICPSACRDRAMRRSTRRSQRYFITLA